MSSKPSEAETYEVTLSRDEQWVVHHLLATDIDEAIDNGEAAPAWALELFETIEAADETAVFTDYQAQQLSDAMTAYVTCEDAPEQDIVNGSSVVDRLEARLESRQPTE
ncbi:DUF7853 family protein [Natronorubrum halophilum]|uniref:DUF7853 family protein n=1 Tax=Natronorubrum halophilum TaxID=1702106 RepID=UPI000EF69DD1|nr:hypothetical protein [Natronorubrum halophilum]